MVRSMRSSTFDHTLILFLSFLTMRMASGMNRPHLLPTPSLPFEPPLPLL